MSTKSTKTTKSTKPAPSPAIFRLQEAAFIEHYDWLIRWALQFTNRDRERAEDLVQEVFAQFAFAQTDLSAVQNIPAYLYTTLRNTHISEVRLAARSHGQTQSIVEYSIADAALEASDPYSLFQTQDQLRRVCRYACLRKQSSRAGSVLILRFFHAYHFSEIAEVLGGTCEAVRQSLKFARNEARLFLENPGALKFIERAQNGGAALSGSVCSAEELLAELRRAIFQSCEGGCFKPDALNLMYLERRIDRADNATLAHIVSCAQCLDSINKKLGLPLLAERHPADALGPNNSRRGGPGASGGPDHIFQFKRRPNSENEELAGSFLLRCRRRATELFEHHPRELCVSVNGYVLGSQSVNSQVSRLRLDVSITEPLSFVEVLSEERARLLVMPIPSPPDGEPTQQKRVTLSEDRSLEVTFQHGHPWPMVEVVYHDPNFSVAAAPVEADISAPSGASAPEPSRESEGQVFFDLFRGLNLLRRPFWTHPSLISGIVSMVLIAALLFFRVEVAPAVTAASLLERASALESLPVPATFAIHRVIKLEQRNHSRGGILATNRVEIWRDSAKNLTVRRLYDQQGRLIAGEWAGAQPAGERPLRKIYERNRPQRIETLARSPHQSLQKQELWQLEPSAREYLEIVGDAGAARLSENSGVYVISYQAKRGDGLFVSGDSLFVKATLTLRKSDLHPVALGLLFNQSGETIEYRLEEVSLEQPALRSLSPATFVLDPELLPKDSGEGDAARRREGEPASAVTPLAASANAALEVEVAYALDRFRTRFGDQLSLTRTPAGILEVKGVVDTEETRKEIRAALSQVSQHPAVKIEIVTVGEVQARPLQTGRVVVREFAGSDEAIAVYGELSRYFSGQPGAERVDEMARNFAARVVSGSRRAVSHSLELKQLSSRFTSAELAELTPSTRIKWFNLIRNHAEALRREITTLDGELRPIFFRNQNRLTKPEGEISNDASLLLAINQLHSLIVANDQVIRSAFAASSAASTGEAVKELSWELARCEKLAIRIQQAAAARE